MKPTTLTDHHRLAVLTGDPPVCLVSGIRGSIFSLRIVLTVLGFLGYLASCNAATITRFSYDDLGRIVKVESDEGRVIEYSYDNLGNRLSRSVRSGLISTNNAPIAVAPLSPTNHSLDVPRPPRLTWSAANDIDAGDLVSYVVYFGTSQNPPLAGSTWQTNWFLPQLLRNTTYFWSVAAKDNHNAITRSPVWTFATTNFPPSVDFAADVFAGWPPLIVHFRALSLNQEDVPLSWEWDFNNDGIPDFNGESEVAYTFSNAGTNSVTLKYMTSEGAVYSLTKTNYITVLATNASGFDLTPASFVVESALSSRNLRMRYSVQENGTLPISVFTTWNDGIYFGNTDILADWQEPDTTFSELRTLNPGSTYYRTNFAYIPYGTDGTHFMIFKADASRSILETNESNNILSLSLRENLPDLVPGSASLDRPPVLGQPLGIVFAITNRGALNLDANWNNAIFLRTNLSGSSAFRLLDSFSVTKSLDAGRDFEITNSVVLPVIPAGNYMLVLRVDQDDSIVEVFETNNVIEIPIAVAAPTVPLIASVTSTPAPLRNRARISAEAYGIEPLIFQWYRDDAILPGAISSVNSFTNVAWEHTGNYRVVVSNPFANSTSSPVAFLPTPGATWGSATTKLKGFPFGLSNWVQVAIGSSYNLGLTADGYVTNWGAILPNPSGLSNVVAVAAGDAGRLALRANGTVVSWGGPLVVPAGLSNVVAIAAGENNLALREDGTVVAWGFPGAGNLNQVPFGLSNVIQIAAGQSANLALNSEGRVTAWGKSNPYGLTNVPASLTNVVAIAAGSTHNLALRRDGTVFAWGSSGLTNPPPDLTNIVAISAAQLFCIAQRADGTLRAWGTSAGGVTNVPAGLTNVVSIASAYSRSVALTEAVPPQIALQPSSLLVGVGKSTTLKTFGRGSAPLRYYWLKNGSGISGATNRTFLISNANFADSGDYQVVCSNFFGSITSTMATITIVDPVQHPIALSGTVDTNGFFTVGSTGIFGVSYVIQGSTDLTLWTNLQTNPAPFLFVDTNAWRFPLQFYRSLIEP